MTLSEELTARGFIHQHTGAELAEILDGEKRTIYHGIDPSADSAHAGNMVIWMLLRHLSDAGHKVIFLVGGGTGMIGDPKPDAERTLQDESVVAVNVGKIQEQAQRLIGGDSMVTFVNNADWLLAQPLVGFLRDIGKHFTVNELVKKDAIAARMKSEQGISYTEFAYPILQAFDYLQLHETYGCDLQIGGSDQWGNIVAGVDLVRRKKQQTVHAITVPLVTDKSTGKKFGKSEGNAIWLDPEKTTPYQFYQFWLNTSDESVIEYLKLFTFITLDDINDIGAETEQDPAARVAQKRLAEEVTTFVHGAETTADIQRVTAVLFSGDAPDADAIALLRAHAPQTGVKDGDSIVAVLVAGGLASSNREARTFIEDGAVTLNGEKVTDAGATLASAQFTDGIALLRRGKKQVCVLSLAG
ncbi:MAG: tyrosine--tRNA ligase [Candidatus Paceibacterota bacterium]